MQGLGRMAVVAVAYYVAGRLALMLAIPPIAAAPVWPAAGIAVAAVLAWGRRATVGVWVASMALNLPWNAPGAVTLSAVLVAGATGVGASLQALVAARLVRRWWKADAVFGERELLAGLLTAGPVASLVSATVGMGSLVVAGSIELGEVFAFWLTWWIGDSIGVAALGPAIAARRAFGPALARSVLVPQLVVLPLLAGVFYYGRNAQTAHAEEEIDRVANQVRDRMGRDAAAYVEIVDSLRRFATAVPGWTEADLELFVAELPGRYPGVRAYEWAPRVARAGRAAYEAEAGRKITRRAPTGDMVAASEREAYFPVTYLVPRSGNERALGLDLASEEMRRATIHQARDSGDVVASPPIALVQSESGKGMLLVAPVYAQPLPTSVDGRRTRFRGVVLAVFTFDELVVGAARGAELTRLSVRLLDGETLLAQHGAADDSGVARRSRLSELQVGGRTWRIVVELGSSPRDSWWLWGGLLGALAVVTLSGMVAFVVAARRAITEAQVASRTIELSRSEQELRQVIRAALDAFVTIDESGRVRAWNPGAERTFGWQREEAVGEVLSELIVPPAVREAHDAGLQRYLRTGDPVMLDRRLELEAVRKDGAVIDVELTISGARRRGEWQFHAFLRDITDRKRTERAHLDAVSRHQLALRASQQAAARALSILDSVSDGRDRTLLADLLRWSLDAMSVSDRGSALSLTALVRRCALRPDGTDAPGVVWRMEHVVLDGPDAIVQAAVTGLVVGRALRDLSADARVEIHLAQVGPKRAELVVADAVGALDDVEVPPSLSISPGPPLIIGFAHARAPDDGTG